VISVTTKKKMTFLFLFVISFVYGRHQSQDVRPCAAGFYGKECLPFSCKQVRSCSGHGICIGVNLCHCDNEFFGVSCQMKGDPRSLKNEFMYNRALRKCMVSGTNMILDESGICRKHDQKKEHDVPRSTWDEIQKKEHDVPRSTWDEIQHRKDKEFKWYLIGITMACGVICVVLSASPTIIPDTFQESMQGPERQQDNEDVCAICLGPFNQRSKVHRLLCFHKFHRHCIFLWIKKHPTCPICRLNVK